MPFCQTNQQSTRNQKMKLFRGLGAGALFVVLGVTPALASGGMGMTLGQDEPRCRSWRGRGGVQRGLVLLQRLQGGHLLHDVPAHPLPQRRWLAQAQRPVHRLLQWLGARKHRDRPADSWHVADQPGGGDQLCVNYFGAGWRMAEFHDGGGGWELVRLRQRPRRHAFLGAHRAINRPTAGIRRTPAPGDGHSPLAVSRLCAQPPLGKARQPAS